MKHFRRLLDATPSQLHSLLDRARELQHGSAPRQFPEKLLGLVFEKPSTRTRVSFEAAAHRLGAGRVFISARDSQMKRGEPVEDMARVMGRYLHGLVMRVFSQDTVDISAAVSGVPVINALSDRFHPCQALADMATIAQHIGRRDDFVLTYFGDGNNVFASLGEAAALLRFELRFCGPEAFDPDPALLAELRARGAEIRVVRDPAAAAQGADVLYTDVWTSMGQEAEAAMRRLALAPYQLNDALLAHAPNAIVLHCLPAHRDEEITASVIEGPQSRVFDQAEQRMWVQMAILEHLWGNGA